jgi:hypothetical protein
MTTGAPEDPAGFTDYVCTAAPGAFDVVFRGYSPIARDLPNVTVRLLMAGIGWMEW